MIRFGSKEAAEAAAELELTEADLTSCIEHQDLNECRRRLEALKARLKKTYRACALRLHPDRTNNDPVKTELFKRVCSLWEETQKLEIGARRRQRPVQQPMNVTIVVTPSGTNNTTTSWGGWTTWQ